MDKLLQSEKYFSTTPYDEKYILEMNRKIKDLYKAKYIFPLSSEKEKTIHPTLWKLFCLKKLMKTDHMILNRHKNNIIETFKKSPTFETFKSLAQNYSLQPMSLKIFLTKSKLKALPDIKSINLFDEAYNAVSAKKGKDFESGLEMLLTENEIKFETENDRRGKTTASTASSHLTPDLYFKDGYLFKNKKHYWIELKSYPGFLQTLNTYHILKQVTKYTNSFGNGILIVNEGFEKEFASQIYKATNGSVTVLAFIA